MFRIHVLITIAMMSVKIYTFGYKFDDHEQKLVSRNVSRVFDIRDLINDLPPRLGNGLRVRDLSGNDQDVRDAIMANPSAQQCVDNVVDDIMKALDNTKKLTIAIGCKSGRHRSITVAIEARHRLEQRGVICNVHNLYFQ